MSHGFRHRRFRDRIAELEAAVENGGTGGGTHPGKPVHELLGLATKAELAAIPAGPKGDKGEKGDPGEPGLPGQDGADGTPGTPGADGQDGTPGADGQDGTPGADGADGQSAYQLAVALGFVGTEAEWIASLKGEQGDPGLPGQDGADGLPGADGADGQQGIQGPKGDTGDQGPPGADGADGEGVPAGIIAMWSGTLATIPTGWALCDGQNGTPDLRDRFVVGAAAGQNPGATGGSATHGHDAHTGIVSHTHGVTVNDPGHAHNQQRFPTATGGSVGFTVDTSMSGTQAAVNPTSTTQTGVTATTAAPAGALAEYAHAASDHRPPFYVLAYIQKL